MNEPNSYFEYLQHRSRIGLLYRKYWLYPILTRYLSGQVLDVGCGIGDFLRFCRNAVGVDVNSRSIEWCQSQGLNAHIMEPDVLPFADDSYDGVMLDNVLEHLSEPTALLAEIARVIRPRGTLVVGVPGEVGYARDTDHKRFYSESALIDCMNSAGFLCKSVLHMPIRSNLLSRSISQYCVYGIFQLGDF